MQTGREGAGQLCQHSYMEQAWRQKSVVVFQITGQLCLHHCLSNVHLLIIADPRWCFHQSMFFLNNKYSIIKYVVMQFPIVLSGAGLYFTQRWLVLACFVLFLTTKCPFINETMVLVAGEVVLLFVCFLITLLGRRKW